MEQSVHPNCTIADIQTPRNCRIITRNRPNRAPLVGMRKKVLNSFCPMLGFHSALKMLSVGAGVAQLRSIHDNSKSVCLYYRVRARSALYSGLGDALPGSKGAGAWS
jgi:hypothetical protein